MIQWENTRTGQLPLVGKAIASCIEPADLAFWLTEHKADVLDRLAVHGAILFRGFAVKELGDFQRIAGVFCEQFSDYVGGNSPRTKVASHVFTATEYPKNAPISMHNEASYLQRMPDLVLFFCAKPAEKGGQTPLADCRRVLNRIDTVVRDRFESNGIRYVNNMHSGHGLGRSWMDVFGTREMKEVETRLTVDGQMFEWKADGGLRTIMQAAAVMRHPMTRESAWINQAEQWHSSSLDPAVRQTLLSMYSEMDLPHHAYFGDGTPLMEEDLSHIRRAMAAEEQVFDWKAGDVLLIDNILVMHGRRPYSGDRRVLVSLGQWTSRPN